MKQQITYIKTILGIDDIRPISELLFFISTLDQYR